MLGTQCDVRTAGSSDTDWGSRRWAQTRKIGRHSPEPSSSRGAVQPRSIWTQRARQVLASPGVQAKFHRGRRTRGWGWGGGVHCVGCFLLGFQVCSWMAVGLGEHFPSVVPMPRPPSASAPSDSRAALGFLGGALDLEKHWVLGVHNSLFFPQFSSSH